MFGRSSSRQLVIVCILLAVAISGLFFLDRASANSDLALLSSPEAAGGPDLFGYTFRDSNEPGGPAYAWEEISGTGTFVTGWTDYDDGYAGPIPIGFAFSYYGVDFTEFYVSTNGYISFGQGWGTIPGGMMPSMDEPNGDIGVFGSDMYLYDYGVESSVYYQMLSNPDRLVLEFVNLHFCCGYTTPHTFEVILYENGDILSQYAALNNTSVEYVGIENSDGTVGLGYGAGLVSDGVAIRYYYPSGILFDPTAQNAFGNPGVTAPYTLSLTNLTGATDSFDLQVLPGNTWTTTLSTAQVGPILDGESITFTTWVEVPVSAQPGDSDLAIIQATSVTSPTVFTNTATISTTAVSEELAYVPMWYTNRLAVIDPQTHTVIDVIDLSQFGCDHSQQVRLTPDGDELYVMCYYSQNIIILETTSHSLVTVIDRPGAYGQDVAFIDYGAYALAGGWMTGGGLPIHVIDTATHTIVQSIPTLGYDITNIVSHPYLPLAYAIGLQNYTNSLLIIDTNTFTIQTIIPFDNVGLSDLQPSPDGQWLYASSYFNDEGLFKIDVSTNMVVGYLAGYGKYGLSISRDSSKIYAPDGDYYVDVIDAINMEPITDIMTGNFPKDNELNCDGSELYVTSLNSGSILIADTLTYDITSVIPIPGEYSTMGIAICPQYLAPKVYFTPFEQAEDGAPGETVTYQETLHNNSGITETFYLEGVDYLWETHLSPEQVGPLQDGESAIFTVTVTVPPDAPWYSSDSVSIHATGATSPSLSAEAEIVTTAFAPAQISVDPSSLESTQLPGEVTSQTLTISNGEGVTLTYDILEEGTYPGKVASLGMNEPPGSTTFYDQSGYGNNATCSGSECPDAGVPGAFGTALSFDGIEDFIQIPHNPEFDEIEDQDKMTLAAWVWINEWYNGYSFVILNQGDAWALELENYGIVFMTGYMQVAVCYTDFNLQEWYHVAVSYDRSLEEMQFYVNGNLECSEYFAADISDSVDDPMLIGYSSQYSLDYANGRMDEFTIFNRAISAEEVTALYQGGLSGEVPWLSVNPASGSVPTGGSVPVQVMFDSTDLQPDIYTTTMFINSNDPLQPLVSIPVTLTVLGTQAGVEITPAEASLSGSPGETVVYTFTLTNLGTLSDSFSLEESSIWTTTLSADTTGELGPGESFTFLASVTIPPEAQDGAQDVALLTATSANDPQVSASAQATTIAVVEPQAAVSITPTEATQTGSPGETLVYTFTLTNQGNVADSFSLEVTSTWTATLPVTATGELGPGETFTFVTYVTIPPEAEDGTQDVALVTATSVNDPTVSAEAQATTSAAVSMYHTCLPLVFKQ